MQSAVTVQNVQGAEQRQQQAAQPGFVRRARHGPARDVEGDPFVVGHHHVSGMVGLPETIHAHQGGVVETGQQPGLVDEGLEARGEGLRVRVGTQGHPRAAAPGRQDGRQVFLDGDLALQGMVRGQIDDAESPSPRTERTSYSASSVPGGKAWWLVAIGCSVGSARKPGPLKGGICDGEGRFMGQSTRLSPARESASTSGCTSSPVTYPPANARRT